MIGSPAQLEPREPWPFLLDRKLPEVIRAEGAYLELRDGRRVLDAAGGAGAINVGHGREEVVEAAARAMREVSYAVPRFATPQRVALVEQLRDHWLPESLSRVHLATSGSEAVELAMMLARKYHVARGRPERWKVVGRDVSYHGGTLAALSVSGHDERRAGLGRLLPDSPRAAACYCLRCPFGLRPDTCRIDCARDLESVVESEDPRQIAAFIAEPVVGPSGGALVPPEDYWPIVQDICKRHDILLIADEITTGFGRAGRKLAVDLWGVVPDVLVTGKGLSGGYAPLAAVMTSESVVEPLKASRQKLASHTYDGHPGACAAASTVLDILRRERLVERVADLGPRLGGLLESRLGDHPHVAEVRGCGFLWAVEIVRDRETLERFPEEADVTRSIVLAGLDLGVFFYPGGTGTQRDTIVLFPPFIIGTEEMERIAGVLERAIDVALARAP